ncbi:hypothetical protein [Sphingomonas sp. 8AM]|uniref:hypothetical protein n=1 Tax=Sphingomonas sp. 8AM TaxID=2653170 RepID=UPI0012F01753|nr:hypothetical protein [Sphingomonas sp. 8AM]VXC97972.1 conserved exported hypothetical protein [Sphingomonas sp. 8AM]
MRRWWAAAALALGMASPAAAAWQQASSRHFVVYSDDEPDKVTEFATRLERFDKAMRVMRGMEDPAFSPSQRVRVFVVKDVGALQKLLGRSDAAGIYMPRLSGPVAFVPRKTNDTGKLALTPQAVLLHEYAHHFMFSSWGDQPFPAWFVEGFAEFNAPTVFEPDRLLIGVPPLYRAYGLIDDSLLPMRDLLTLAPGDKRLDPNQRQVFYGRAWLLTHYMLLNNERRPQLAAYLKALEKGGDPKTAAALLGDPRKLDRELNNYARKTLPILGMKIDKLPIGPVTTRALGAGEEAIMPVVLRSTRGVNPRTAPAVAVAARKVAVDFPNDPAVQVALAEAEYDAGGYAAADAAAARALAARPGLREALIYRGMAQSALAEKEHVTDAARWKAVRQWFITANHLDPEDPWPLVAHYQALRSSGGTMSGNAEKGLDYAFSLAPFDSGLAMQVAAMHIRKKEYDAAVPALRRVAYDPHGGALGTMAGTVLTAIESKDTSAIDTIATAMESRKENDGEEEK